MTRLLSSLLLVCIVGLINQSIAQSYVPQVAPITSCPTGQTFVSFGSNDVSLLAVNTATTMATANYLYTTYFNTTSPVTINQLSFGINDNLQITSVAQLRLGLMMINQLNMVKIGQTEEILLYASGRDVIYANLETPVQLLPSVQYAITFWSNTGIYTGVDTVPVGTSSNSAFLTYSPNGLPYSQAMAYSYGKRALQATGCMPENDPYTSPDTQLYSFCAYAQVTSPPSPPTTYLYVRSTMTYVISGVLAVSRTQTGTSASGTWNRVVGGFANYVMSNSGPWYYPSVGPSSGKVLTLGAGGITTANQRLYPTGASRVDAGGISFVASDGSQYVLSFANGSVALSEMSRGSMSFVSGSDFAGISAAPTDRVNNVLACVVPTRYVPDTFTCAADEVTVAFGDDSLENAMAEYSTPTNYAYGNFIYFREFTANTFNTVLKQLTFRIWANPGKLVKMRMAIYTANVSAAAVPTYTLVEQTREVVLINPAAGVIALNLLRDLSLVEGRNYTIAMIADHWLYCAYGYFAPAPYFYTFPYETIAPNSMPQLVQSVTLNYVLPMGANGCLRQQRVNTIQICANFVYADRINQYYGTLDVLENSRLSERGPYYQIISGSGFSNRTTTANVRTMGNWTLKSYNLPSNNRYYGPSAFTSQLDTSGLQIVVSNPSAGYAVQIAGWLDPASASWEFREYQQNYNTYSPLALANVLLGTVQFRTHQRGDPVICNAPARPRNLVSPLSVARTVCPNNENAIADTAGTAFIQDWEVTADGTLIEANRIYTNSFVAESTGTVRQLAIGILNNMDRVGAINVRLGLYNAATNQLLGQASQLSLTEAVDQLIVMNLPTPIIIEAGQRYHIALISSAPLEVATSSTANSPSMTSTFATTGLPTTFASTGNGVSVSIAAYVCVTSTHSVCAYFQYSPSIGASTTMMYQGLVQAGSAQTNAYGTFVPVTAWAGRLTMYARTAASPTNTMSLFVFSQRPGTIASLYTSSTNGFALDTTGVILEFTNGASSNIQFNSSINKIDESFRSTDREIDLIYSGIRIQALGPGGSIPSCGLATVDRSSATNIPLPTCPSDQELVSFGDADSGDVANSQEGLYAAPASQIFLRQFTSHPTRASVLNQVRFGININYNTVNRIRMGLYDQNYTFLASSNEIVMYNPDNQMFTGTLTTAQYLHPNTVYYLAWWTEASVYAGFSSVAGPAGLYPFSGPWPTKFVDTNPNSQRAIGGFGCTTNSLPPGPVGPVGPEPSTNTTSTSSSSNLSGGAVAGIVIGCVIGTNLLLLACLYLCCVGGAVAGGKGTNWKHMETEESRTTASNVELGEVSSTS